MQKQKKRKWPKRLLIGFLVLILVAIVAVPLLLASFVMTGGDRQTLDEAMQWQSERYDTSFYDELEKSDYEVAGYEGYTLHVELLKNPKATDRYVIISHGYTDNRMGALKYVPMYLDLGFNCIIYDLRGHGENERTFTTYGILESEDLLCIVKDTRERYPQLTELGLHGESLGAATTITALKGKPDVDFVVADCGFSDIENVLKEGYRNAGVPTFLVDVASIGARIRYGYSIKSMRPIDSLDSNQIPVLFIHGEADDLILPQNSIDMYERTAGMKELQLIPKAGHAESILVDPVSYHKYVREFIEKARQSDDHQE